MVTPKPIADERGSVDVPRTARTIGARWEEAFGFLRLDRSDTSDQQLLLHADGAMSIQVLGTDGVPCADIRVSIATYGTSGGRDGCATLRHWPAHLDKWQPVERAVARMHYAGAPQHGHVITEEELDAGLVQLHMPATGSLMFELPQGIDPADVSSIECFGLDARGKHFSSWLPAPYSRRSLLIGVALGLNFSTKAHGCCASSFLAMNNQSSRRTGSLSTRVKRRASRG